MYRGRAGVTAAGRVSVEIQIICVHPRVPAAGRAPHVQLQAPVARLRADEAAAPRRARSDVSEGTHGGHNAPKRGSPAPSPFPMASEKVPSPAAFDEEANPVATKATTVVINGCHYD